MFSPMTPTFAWEAKWPSGNGPPMPQAPTMNTANTANAAITAAIRSSTLAASQTVRNARIFPNNVPCALARPRLCQADPVPARRAGGWWPCGLEVKAGASVFELLKQGFLAYHHRTSRVPQGQRVVASLARHL